MATNENLIPIPGRLHSVATEGHVAGADEIYDDTIGKTQAEINQTIEPLPDSLAYLGDDDGQAVIPGFDPQTDTLHKAAQVLTTAEKDQVAQNLNNRPSTNGMARIELKATDNFKTVVESQTGGNTVFVIKYDYTLTGNVTVPENCILEFDGGSISASGSNDTITGNNTLIKADEVKIFSDTVLFDGNFNNKTISVKNFGAVGDNVSDDTNAFKAALRYIDTCYDSYSNTGVMPSKSMHGSYLSIPNGVYKLTDTLTIKSQTIIRGESIEGVVLESYADIGIVLEGTLYNGSPYIQNVTLENFFLIMNGGKVGIKNNISAALGDCTFKNFTIQSAEVGILFRGIWNSRFENVCVESVNFGVILASSSNGGCNNNIIDNLKIVSANKCGLYLSSANATYCTNLNIEGIGNTWEGNYTWCGVYSNISTTVDEVVYDVENPCAVYTEGLAYSNVFNCSWFEAIHATDVLAICYLVKNASTHPSIHRMSITITDGYFNNDVDLPIKLATSAAVYLSRLNYWGNFDNGSIVIDYANNAYIDISFVHKYWITNIVSSAERVSKWVNIHHVLDDYQNIVNNYTLQAVQGYQLERNKYDNGDSSQYTVYYGKRIDAARKLIINYADADINAFDYGTHREVSISNGGTYSYKTTDNGVITLPGTFTYGANYVIKLTALDTVGAIAIAGGYYISDNDFQSLKVSFVNPPSADCNFNYYVDLPLTL